MSRVDSTNKPSEDIFLPEVFISSRYTDHALPPRRALITELQNRFVPVWDGVLKSNQDILRVVTSKIDATPLAVVLATADYAEDTKVFGNTLSEIRLLRQLHEDEDIRKPFLYIKMCKKFKFTIAKTMLPHETVYDYEWLPDEVTGEFGPPPSILIDLIVQKYKEITACVPCELTCELVPSGLPTVFETSRDEFDDSANGDQCGVNHNVDDDGAEDSTIDVPTLPFQDSHIPYSHQAAFISNKPKLAFNTESLIKTVDATGSGSLQLNLGSTAYTPESGQDPIVAVDTAYRAGSGKFMHVLSPENRPRNRSRSRSGSETPRPFSGRFVPSEGVILENDSATNQNVVNSNNTPIEMVRRFTCDATDSDYERFQDTEEGRMRLEARGRHYKTIGCFTGKMPSPRYGDNSVDKTDYSNKRAARVNEATSIIKKVFKAEAIEETNNENDRKSAISEGDSSTGTSESNSVHSADSDIPNDVIPKGMVTQRKALFESKLKLKSKRGMFPYASGKRSTPTQVQILHGTFYLQDYRKSGLVSLLRQNIESRSKKLSVHSIRKTVTAQALLIKSTNLRKIKNAPPVTKTVDCVVDCDDAEAVDENCRHSINSLRESE